MNRTAAKRPRKPNELSRAVGKVFRRAGKQVGIVAKAYGTPVYILKDGKVVADDAAARGAQTGTWAGGLMLVRA